MTAVTETNRNPVLNRSRHGFGFWAVAYVFLVLLAFSTAPSPLYVLYARRDHFSSLMITLIYAAYAVGVLGSLLLISHLSDVHGRRPHLLGAVALAIASAVVFMVAPSLPGLFVARILCGVSVGLTMGTASAYLNELHAGRQLDAAVGRAQLVTAVASFWGLSVGALLAGLLAQYASYPLVVPYAVLLAALVVAAIVLVAAPETRERTSPRPAYRPQTLSAPAGARPQYFAALLGVCLAYAGPAVFIGLAGTFLATVVHDTSLALVGWTIFTVFTVGVVVLLLTSKWPVRRLVLAGIALEVIGLALVVVAAWLPSPSLGLFIAGGGVIGAAGGQIYKGTLGSIVAISSHDKLGTTLAGYFVSAYVGLSIPVIGIGVALQYVSARGALLAFAIIVGGGLLGASRTLLKVHPNPKGA